MDNRTSEGLRERLFTALDLFMEKKVSSKEIEGVCYLSEQIIKTANVELEFQREFNRSKQFDKEHALQLKKEENAAAELLQITLKKAVEVGEVEEIEETV